MTVDVRRLWKRFHIDVRAVDDGCLWWDVVAHDGVEWKTVSEHPRSLADAARAADAVALDMLRLDDEVSASMRKP